MLDFTINLKKDFNIKQEIIIPYLPDINKIIKYDYMNLEEMDNNVIIFMFYVARSYRNILKERLFDIEIILDKLKVNKNDILKNLKVKIYNDIMYVGPNDIIKQLCGNLEYGMPGIVQGIPTINLFSKLNNDLQKQYELVLISYNNYK